MSHRRDLVWPLILVIVGVLLLLRTLGYVPPSLDQWWPVILIVIGLWVLLSRPGEMPSGQPLTSVGRTLPRHVRRPTSGLILIGLGLALLAGNYLGGRTTGALILIALGLAFLAGRIWQGTRG